MAALALALLAASGCRRQEAPAPAGPLEARAEQAGLAVVVRVDPARVQPPQAVMLTLTVETDVARELQPPDLSDRAEGFVFDGQYEAESSVVDGRSVRTFRARLVPRIADEYRIAPIPVITDAAWVATPPLVLEAVALPAGGSVPEPRPPVWIAPDVRTVALWTGLALAGLAALAGGVWLWRHSRRTPEQRRSSARARALRELAALLARALPEHGQVKAFYFELTMIVRRYIERAHGIRAPEQTTEEFLAAVAVDARFTPATVGRLTEFLQAADLVKYAAHQPGSEAVQRAIETARAFIEQDTATLAEEVAPT